MAGINFGNYREAIHNFALESDAEWQAKQKNLFDALDNVINIGVDGLSGKQFGFAANSENDNKKILGLLAGWLRYKGFDDDAIFSNPGGKSLLSAMQPQGQKADERNDAIREFYNIFVNGNSKGRAEALVAIVQNMGEYSVEMPDITGEMNIGKFKSYINDARINGFIADSLSSLFFSPEEYNSAERPTDIHFNSHTMNAFWSRLNVKDIEGFNKSADYTRIHRDMALVAEGFVDAAKREEFLNNTDMDMSEADSDAQKKAAAVENYIDKYGKYNISECRNFKTKDILPEFCDEFDIPDNAAEDSTKTFNSYFTGQDNKGIEQGRADNTLRNTNTLDPYILGGSDIDILNTLLGTENKYYNNFSSDEVDRIFINGKSIPGRKPDIVAQDLRKALVNGVSIAVMDKKPDAQMINTEESRIRVFVNDPNSFTKKSRSGEKKENAKIFFNSLFGTKDKDTKGLVARLRTVTIDGARAPLGWDGKGFDIVKAYDAFMEAVKPKVDIENFKTTLPNVLINHTNGPDKNKKEYIERVVISPYFNSLTEKEILNSVLGTDIRSNAELKNELNRIMINNKGMGELLTDSTDQIKDAVKRIEDACRDKDKIDVLPPPKGHVTLRSMSYETSAVHENIDLKAPASHHRRHREKFEADNFIVAVSEREKHNDNIFMDIEKGFYGKSERLTKEQRTQLLSSIYINGQSAVGLTGDIKEEDILSKYTDIMNTVKNALKDPKNTVALIPKEAFEDPDNHKPKIIYNGALDAGFKMNKELSDEIMAKVNELTEKIKAKEIKTREDIINERAAAEAERKAREEAERRAREEAERREREEAERRAREEAERAREEAARREAERRRFLDEQFRSLDAEMPARPNMNIMAYNFVKDDGSLETVGDLYGDGIAVLSKLSGLSINKNDYVNGNTWYGSDLMRAADRLYIGGIPARAYFNVAEDASVREYEEMGYKIRSILNRSLGADNSGQYVMFKAENEDEFHAFTFTLREPEKPEPVEQFTGIKRFFSFKETKQRKDAEYNAYLEEKKKYDNEFKAYETTKKTADIAKTAARSIKYINTVDINSLVARNHRSLEPTRAVETDLSRTRENNGMNMN